MICGYKTNLGKCECGDSFELLDTIKDNSINLVITSPPFALQRKKVYGNKNQTDYVDWFLPFAAKVKEKLTDDGSFVVDLGGAYQKGRPVRSIYNYRLLIQMCDELKYNLAEEFFWYNPAKLPSPIEWVNKRKIRVKDSVNTIWWFSKSDFPKANVQNVLVPYSNRMKKLIENPEKFYKAKNRPSGHNISNNFAKNNGGAIPSNLLQYPNTDSSSQYLKFCKELQVKSHPARFPETLPRFFINYLTDKGDFVVDIFSGSNTTGFVCENNGRKWESFELSLDYVANSVLRFATSTNQGKSWLNKILNKNEFVNLTL